MAVIETAPWKRGDIIRNANTGKPFLVIHVYTNLATMIADPEERDLQPPVLLLQKDYYRYAKDVDMECKESDSLLEPVIIGWEHRQIQI